MTKNKGYTLMEVIIVIAIMAILTSVSFVTIGIIKDARRSSAASTFDNQISSCLIRTKAVSETDSALCMVIKKRNDGTYAILTGYNDGSIIKDGSGNTLDHNTDLDAALDLEYEAILPDVVTRISYTAPVSDSKQKLAFVSDNEMVIQFVKSDGSVQYGAGTYELYSKKNGKEYKFASIQVDAESGNHYIK